MIISWIALEDAHARIREAEARLEIGQAVPPTALERFMRKPDTLPRLEKSQ